MTINADNIEQVVFDIHPDPNQEIQQVLRKLQFGREAQAMSLFSPDFHHLSISPANSAPKWDSTELRFPSVEILGRAREAFLAGRLVGFDVPVRVKRLDGSVDEEASFEIYFRKAAEDHPLGGSFPTRGVVPLRSEVSERDRNLSLGKD